MKISELIDNLPITLIRGSGAREISQIVEDSRQVTPGCLFVARRGTEQDGRKFIRDAVNAGAVAVLSDESTESSSEVATLQAGDVSVASAMMAERLANHPSHQLSLVGITGTNGKTTVAHIAHQILSYVGIRTGLMGTVLVHDGKRSRAADLTTPAAVDVSRTLNRMVRNGCRNCLMEVSSHALDQNRVIALEFAGAVFTNISGDHLDYHGTMEAYRKAKTRLFRAIDMSGWAVINKDDPASREMIQHCSGRIFTTSLQDPDCDYWASVQKLDFNGTHMELNSLGGQHELRLKLIGEHNVANALQAFAICHQLGMDEADIISVLPQCTAPAGRLNPVQVPRVKLNVFIDYAHTDDALANVLKSLRPLVPTGGLLRAVFGCGGDRDHSKRPRMAQVACRMADEIIITSDNPRREDPEAIVADILAGVSSSDRPRVQCEIDREQAIHLAIRRSAPDDVVLIAGKGHEDYQIIGSTKRHFDDQEIAINALSVWRGKVKER